MRLLVFVLVLLNLVLLAYTQTWLNGGSPESVRLGQQIAPERIRVVSRGSPPAGAETAVPAPAANPADRCLAWKSVDTEGAKQLSTLLAEPRFAGLKVVSSKLDAPVSWWVFIPPSPTRADAERKAGQLQRLGVADFFVVQTSGATRNSISLGIFSSEQGARDHLAALQAKGVRSARVGPRDTGDERFSVELRGAETDLEAARGAAERALPAAKPVDCQEPATR